MGKLDGRVAVITGGGRGQGRAHAVALAAAGADVVIGDLDRQIKGVPYSMNSAGDMAETVAQVDEMDRRCVAVVADVRDPAATEALAATALEECVDRKVYQNNLRYIPNVPRIPPSDVAKAVVFLASDDARYISGGTVDVGAGYAANHT